jgi:glycosyltransferase involved in cell wall biosynthesis
MNGRLSAVDEIRVAMVIQSFAPAIGGAERQLQRLAPRLAERGVRATVITRAAAGAPRRERLAGLDVIRVPVPGSPSAASVSYTIGGAILLAAMRVDIVHVHGLLSPASVALLGARAPIVAKVLASGPDGDVDVLLRKPLGRRRLRAIARRFDRLISLSRETDAELLAHGVPAQRIARIANGVDPDRFRPPRPGERERLRERFGLSADRPVAFYCGRLAPRKRVALLLDVVRRLPGCDLVIAGTGTESARIAELAADPELAGRVHLLGAVEDPAPLYRLADLYVSLSVREGLSGSALEAMASGVAVAASPASGMRDLLADGAGVILGGDSPTELASQLQPLLDDREHRARIGVAARSRVGEHYSLEATAEGLRRLYAGLRRRGERRTTS